MVVRKKLNDSGSKNADTAARYTTNQTGDDSSIIGKGTVEGGERVDQIRDILFGAQRQEYERRFSRLEEFLVKNISELSKETAGKFSSYQEEYDKKFARLEELLVKNISDISHEIERKINLHKGENDERFRESEEQFKKTTSELEEETRRQFNLTKSEYGQKLNDLEGKLANAISDLRKKLDSDVASLKKDIGIAKSEAVRSLEHLDTNKVDRSALAKFLHHVAAGIENKDHKTDSGEK